MKLSEQQSLLHLFENGIYVVTSNGDAYSNRNYNHGLHDAYRCLRRSITKDGYEKVHLSAPGLSKAFYLHQVVWLYWYGLYNPCLQINHINGNKRDNRITNLELSTKSQNIKHAFATGIKRNRKGDMHPQTKISDSAIDSMRALYATRKHSQRELAYKFGISFSLAHQILRGKHR